MEIIKIERKMKAVKQKIPTEKQNKCQKKCKNLTAAGQNQNIYINIDTGI